MTAFEQRLQTQRTSRTFLTILMQLGNGIGKCDLAHDNDARNAINAAGGEIGYLNRETGLEVTDEIEIKK